MHHNNKGMSLVEILIAIVISTIVITAAYASYSVIRKSTRGKALIIVSALSVLFWIIEAIQIYFIMLAFGIDTIGFFTGQLILISESFHAIPDSLSEL